MDYFSVYKVTKIRDALELKYSEGDCKLESYVQRKFDLLKWVFPNVLASDRLRMIVASFEDKDLRKRFSSITSDDFYIFKKNANIYDKLKGRDDSVSSDKQMDYNVKELLDDLRKKKNPRTPDSSRVDLNKSTFARLTDTLAKKLSPSLFSGAQQQDSSTATNTLVNIDET